MNLGAQSGLLATIVSAAVAISVLLRGRRVALNSLFIVFSANLFVHFLASFFHRFSDLAVWMRVDLIASSLLPVTSILFFGNFLWRDPAVTRPYLRTAYVLSGLAVVLLISPWGSHRVAVAVMLVYVFLALYVCAWLVYNRYQEIESQREQTRLRILMIVMLVATTFVFLGMLPGSLGFLRTWGDLVSVFFLYFLSQSLLSARLLDIQELLGRGLVLMAVALILAVVFGILVLWAGGSPEVSLFHTFVASFVILILFEPLRDKVEGSTSLLFFRERYELRRKLENLRREIANIIDLRQMSAVLLDTLYDSMHFNRAAIYLKEDGETGFYLAGSRGPDPPERIGIAAHRSFFEQLEKTPTVILAETFERLLAEQDSLSNEKPSVELRHAQQVLETLRSLGAGICIPLVVQGNEVLGLWTLQDESGGGSYSTEEIARMMAVGEQAAINIENSKLFERIRERDRLVILGEMAAGLAHEIRNPLGAIKGAAQYLDPAAVGEHASEFLRIIIEETDRLNKVVDQFLDYSRPFRALKEKTDINNVVENTVRLVRQGLEENKIELKLELDGDLDKISANAQQLTQVLLNLINNAQEAMPGGGKLTIRTIQHDRAGGTRLAWPVNTGETGAIEIQVEDTGRGIPSEAMERLFVPFFTTKERGTGLGLAISQRIVEHHGGKIRIRSENDKGSTFSIVLPLVEEQTLPPPEIQIQSDEIDDMAHPRGDDLPFPTGNSTEKP